MLNRGAKKSQNFLGKEEVPSSILGIGSTDNQIVTFKYL